MLAEKCRKVVAVEIDPRVFDVLKEELKHVENVELVLGDALKVSLPAVDKVVSVPPYKISSRLLFFLLSQPPECAVLVLQREFAEKLVAEVGSPYYGRLSVLAYYEVEAKIMEHVSKHVFYPQPKVDSVVIRLKRRNTKPFQVRDEKAFTKLLRIMFTQRNRKARKVLQPFLVRQGYERSEAARVVDSLVFRDRRVRDLAPEDFGAIANVLA